MVKKIKKWWRVEFLKWGLPWTLPFDHSFNIYEKIKRSFNRIFKRFFFRETWSRKITRVGSIIILSFSFLFASTLLTVVSFLFIFQFQSQWFIVLTLLLYPDLSYLPMLRYSTHEDRWYQSLTNSPQKSHT